MILVAGATGLVGRDVCHRLAAQGTPARALVRPTSNCTTATSIPPRSARFATRILEIGPMAFKARLPAAIFAGVSAETRMDPAQP